MDRQDWITFLLAIGIVIGIAVVVNFPKFEEEQTTVTDDTISYIESDTCADGSCCTPKIHYKYDTKPQTGPLRIYYNNNLNEIYSPGATGYPRLHLPESMMSSSGDSASPDRNIYGKSFGSIYASSDIFPTEIWQSEKITTFAYIEESNSGFSRIFGSPYPVWRIHVTMTPEDNPAYSALTWILVDSSTGDVITGGKVLHGEKILKKVEVSNRNFYFLIEAENVDSFKIELETPEISYNQAHINPRIIDLTSFLNTMQN
ncbi:MAG: hypothetical protein JXQ82_01965 [Methanomicrobiaceae archaeon]|nr:hypothetical protein [Methanomicrobiaceae archaeon]